MIKIILGGLILVLLSALATLIITHRYSLTISLKERVQVDPNPNKVNGPTPANPQNNAPALDYLKIKKLVLPENGFQLPVAFEDLGPELLRVGAIDLAKFTANFAETGLTATQMEILTQKNNLPIFIDEKNALFLVDFFWALGLANQNKILDEGPLSKDRSQIGNFASTGGWTLGRYPATELFSKFEIVKLTSDQQRMVEEILATVFRPCCGNAAIFPDCNHGMAALGLTEYLASKNLSRDEIYRALLHFNSFWFPQNYLDIATSLELKGISWDRVNPQLPLGAAYSSGSGYARVKQELTARLDGSPAAINSGRGCGT